MSEYKLTYFNARGLTEPIRFIFAYSNVKYEDFRVPFLYNGDVPIIPQVLPQEIKDKCPWGQVPLLEFDEGKKLGQSKAIARFLARKFNLTGADDYEAAKCDEYVDTVMDFFKDFLPVFTERDPAKKLELAEKLEGIMGPKFFSKFDAIVADNGGKCLVGKQITWADLYFVAIVNSAMTNAKVDFLSTFSNLRSLRESVLSTPQIKTWIESRPKSEF